MEQIYGGLFFAALGTVFILVGCYSWRNTRRFVAESVPAFGEVVGLKEQQGDGVTYSPVIRFSATGGRAVEFTETTSSNPPGYSVGERVRVLYRPDDPKGARVASPFRLYLFAAIFGGIGATFFVIGLLVAVLAVAV
jgi:hypothetical protein